MEAAESDITGALSLLSGAHLLPTKPKRDERSRELGAFRSLVVSARCPVPGVSESHCSAHFQRFEPLHRAAATGVCTISTSSQYTPAEGPRVQARWLHEGVAPRGAQCAGAYQSWAHASSSTCGHGRISLRGGGAAATAAAPSRDGLQALPRQRRLKRCVALFRARLQRVQARRRQALRLSNVVAVGAEGHQRGAGQPRLAALPQARPAAETLVVMTHAALMLEAGRVAMRIASGSVCGSGAHACALCSESAAQNRRTTREPTEEADTPTISRSGSR